MTTRRQAGRTFRLAMAQIDVTVGDLDGNAAKIVEYVERARALGADLVAFPELAVTGYPPEDLVFKPQFVRENQRTMRRIVALSRGIAMVFGFVDGDEHLYNAAAISFDGSLAAVYHKILLPNYGVFDEKRYFTPGTQCPVFVVNGTPIGVSICEDIWYEEGPTARQRASGAELIVNINGSPFYTGRKGEREEMLREKAANNDLFIGYVNLVGGQDELVFDGGSMVVAPTGEILVQGVQFDEELVLSDIPIGDGELFGEHTGVDPPTFLSAHAADKIRPPIQTHSPQAYDEIGEVYAALVTGTQDYVRKCGFDKVLVALSGGIDSSLVATVAVDALGSDNVVGVSMPSRYSSDGSVTDTRLLTANLGIELKTLPIEGPFSAFRDTLAPEFAETEEDLTEENLQARIRGTLVMALSNKFGWLVLTTGNKSELATGYATLYGDMAGGFAVIKDVPKTFVYRLAEHRNRQGPSDMVPRSVLEKAPSAELRPGQTDQDSLPPYEVLDPILKAYVEDNKGYAEMVAMGFDKAVVRQVIGLVDRSEYKRRQAPPGVKITPRNFGRDRRMPISDRYRPVRG